MQDPSPALTGPPPAFLLELEPDSILWILMALLLSGFFKTLQNALTRSLPARVLGKTRDKDERARLEPLLARVDRLITSAWLLKISCNLAVIGLLLSMAAQDFSLGWEELLPLIAIGAPALLLFTETLPASLARTWGDELLIKVLPTFNRLQYPIVPLGALLSVLQRAVLRALRLREASTDSRILVEGLRDVIEGATDKGELEDAERELIENVMEFGDVDAAEVMTPRTEIDALPVDSSIKDAAAVFSEAGHSRIPVYEENVDVIIGTVTALEVTKALTSDRPASVTLRSLMRPPLLVPETKLISELLVEFRVQKQKMAVVLDEYGGTAGVVTLTDVLEEIVGDIQDEYEENEEPILDLGDGTAEIHAGLHVSEVNEALGLSIPEEEDFETLGGYVLAELGHFPKQGETFEKDMVVFSVVEASDRRVYKVRVRKPA